jgi:hypothetical protein
MTIKELIAALSALQEKLGENAEVLAQSHGCCMHGHEICEVTEGAAKFQGVDTAEEVGCVVIRV